MRVLIVPMAAMAPTAGPSYRTRCIAREMQKEGLVVATCQAQDVNYKPIEDIENYHLTVPSPMGMPSFVGTHIFPIVQKLGVNRFRSVDSFDEVLHLTGNTDYAYLLYEGSVLHQGDPETMANDPDVREKYLGRDFKWQGKKETKRI